MTFKIPDITWDIGHFCNLLLVYQVLYHMRHRTFFQPITSVPGIMYVGLHEPEWLYVLGIPPRADVPLRTPEHVTRTSARAQTCVWGPGGLPVCHRAESTRKDPRPEEKKMPKGEKAHFFIYIYSSLPFGGGYVTFS